MLCGRRWYYFSLLVVGVFVIFYVYVGGGVAFVVSLLVEFGWW